MSRSTHSNYAVIHDEACVLHAKLVPRRIRKARHCNTETKREIVQAVEGKQICQQRRRSNGWFINDEFYVELGEKILKTVNLLKDGESYEKKNYMFQLINQRFNNEIK